MTASAESAPAIAAALSDGTEKSLKQPVNMDSKINCNLKHEREN